MRRIFNLLEYSLLSLSRRWQRQMALVIIYSVVVGFFGSVVFMTASLKEETRLVLQYIPDIWVQQLRGGRLVPADTGMVNEIQQIRGVEQVRPRIWGYLFDTPTGAVFTVTGSTAPPADLQILDLQRPGPLTGNEAIVGTGFLEMRGLSRGDRMTIVDSNTDLRTFTIAGAFEAASDLLTKDLLVFNDSTARQLLGLQPGEVTDISLSVFNPDEVENIARKIDKNYSGIRVVTKAELRATYEALFSWRGGIFLYGAIISILAFIILAWDRASGLSREERRELGILKGIGWEIKDILLMKFWEGIAISLTATLLGILLAWVHVYLLQAPLLKPFFIGWSVMYPDYHLLPALETGDLLTILFISVVPYLSATLIPSWAGAVTDPAEIMRQG